MPRTDGFDVSEYQPNTDWAFVAGKHPNITFVCVKATQGAGYVDRQFAYNWSRLRDQVSRGWSPARTDPYPPVLIAYHFMHTGSASQQAAHFGAVVGPLRPGETVMVDVEDNPQLGIPTYPASSVQALLAEIAARMNRVPILYMGNYYGGGIARTAPELRPYPYWLPAYVNNPAAMQPTPRPWLIWQWGTPRGQFGNPGQEIDSNEVTDAAELRRLAHIPTEEDDMPLTDDDVAKVARAAASQFLETIKVDGNGTPVYPEGNTFRAAVVSAVGSVLPAAVADQAGKDAIGKAVADELAARLKG